VRPSGALVETRRKGRGGMTRLTAVLSRFRQSAEVPRLAQRLSHEALPLSPREPLAALDAVGPSLMPRSWQVQGVVIGVSVLATRATNGVVNTLTRAVVPVGAPLPAQLAARAVLTGAGSALAALPVRDSQHFWAASLRSMGQLLRDGAAAGAVGDLGFWLHRRYPDRPLVRPVTVGAVSAAGLLYRAGRRRLAAQDTATQRMRLPSMTSLAGALTTSAVVTAAGTELAQGFTRSRNAIESYLGPGPSKQALARLVNAGIWGAAGAIAYNLGVAYIGRTNEMLAPAYASPPDNPMVSGSPESLLPFADLGWEGRRYVTDVVTPELIEQVMGDPAVAQPIRTYVGFNSEPRYRTGRAELALAELERTGAFNRSTLLLVSPTGTGWVDNTMIEAAEFLTRGDIATCCIQYARYPSFLSVQKVALGRAQFRLLLWGVKLRLAALPPEQRPRVLVFGESLGAWTSSDVIMFQGIEGFEHYGIDRALWVGLPWLAKWSRSGMSRGSSTLVPAGTVGGFDRYAQLAALDDEQRRRLRAVVLSHDNDPIAVVGPDLLTQQPTWLANGERGRGVPAGMRWQPLITFVQTGMDAMNVLVSAPGEFGSFGHDYRADMARFVRDTFDFPIATDAQLANVEKVLRSLELERADNLTAKRSYAPSSRRVGSSNNLRGGVPLRERRTPGARWVRRRGPNALADDA
jgi:uncharacterized membrane protein